MRLPRAARTSIHRAEVAEPRRLAPVGLAAYLDSHHNSRCLDISRRPPCSSLEKHCARSDSVITRSCDPRHWDPLYHVSYLSVSP